MKRESIPLVHREQNIDGILHGEDAMLVWTDRGPAIRWDAWAYASGLKAFDGGVFPVAFDCSPLWADDGEIVESPPDELVTALVGVADALIRDPAAAVEARIRKAL